MAEATTPALVTAIIECPVTTTGAPRGAADPATRARRSPHLDVPAPDVETAGTNPSGTNPSGTNP